MPRYAPNIHGENAVCGREVAVLVTPASASARDACGAGTPGTHVCSDKALEGVFSAGGLPRHDRDRRHGGVTFL